MAEKSGDTTDDAAGNPSAAVVPWPALLGLGGGALVAVVLATRPLWGTPGVPRFSDLPWQDLPPWLVRGWHHAGPAVLALVAAAAWSALATGAWRRLRPDGTRGLPFAVLLALLSGLGLIAVRFLRTGLPGNDPSRLHPWSAPLADAAWAAGALLPVLVVQAAARLLASRPAEAPRPVRRGPARAARLAFAAAGAATVAAFLVTGLRPGRPAPDPRLPDVLLVTVDTLRADRLGVYGYELPTSPLFDAWAAGGTVFTRAISPAGWTAPATAAILTSRFPSELGMESNEARLPEEAVTLAEELRDRGYETAAFVGNYILRRRSGMTQGFGIYDDVFPAREAVRGYPERNARETTDAALAWFAGRKALDRPVFLWVHYQDPHGPYDPADPPDWSPDLDAYGEPRGIRGLKVPAYQMLRGRTDAREYLAGYDREIRSWDGEFARLIAGLEGRGRPRLTVMTADHGETLEEEHRPQHFAHGTGVWPELLRVPLVIRGPGIPAGRRVDAPVSAMDVLPTVLGVLGEAPAGDRVFRGRDLSPAFGDGEGLPADRIVLGEFRATAGDGMMGAYGPGGGAILWKPDRWLVLPGTGPGEAVKALERALVRHGHFVRVRGNRGLAIDLTEEEQDALRGLGYLD